MPPRWSNLAVGEDQTQRTPCLPDAWQLHRLCTKLQGNCTSRWQVIALQWWNSFSCPISQCWTKSIYPMKTILNSPVFQTAYMPIKGKLFCFWCNFFVVFRFFLYVGLVKQLGDLKRKKTFLSLAKKRKCGFHPFFFEDLFNSLYEDTHFFSLRLSYLFKTLVVGWEISVKHKFCTYKESLRNFRDLLFRG